MLIADEPTTALDVTVQAQILELMGSLKSDFNTAIVLITHDLGVIAGLADRVMVMYAGRVVESASVRELFYNPQHPYSAGLLKSMPRLSSPKDERLLSIPGQPPNLQRLPPGCAYRPRCPCPSDRCQSEIPVLRSIGPGRSKACHAEAI